MVMTKEERKEYDRQYYITNKEEIKEYDRQHYITNKDAIAERQKQYYIDNKDAIIEQQKQYRLEHKEEIKEYNNQYIKNRRQNDPVYRLRTNISRIITQALKRSDGSKQGNSIMEYLPYTIEELKAYLEKQFEPWMNWNNYGKWHIDHIIPQSKLPYETMDCENFQKCWALDNLRPLEAIANIKKGNK